MNNICNDVYNIPSRKVIKLPIQNGNERQLNQFWMWQLARLAGGQDAS